MTQSLPPQKLAVSRKEAAALLSIGVDAFDRYVREHVECVYIGSKRVWPVTELNRWLREQSRGTLVSDK